jgi:pimeloyl-ACP methyl ester carboxylesterase
MPTIDVNGTRIHYMEQGSGPETVVFSHSYLLDGSHFQPSCTHPLPDISILESYPTHEAGFDMGTQLELDGLRG